MITPARSPVAGSPWALVRPLAIIAITIGFVVGSSGNLVLADGPVTFASQQMFSSDPASTVDLKLNGQDSVQAIIGATPMAPGDNAVGFVDITGETALFEEPFDLDVDIRYSKFGSAPHPTPGDPVPLEKWLHFSNMKYGEDDLLAPPGRNLIQEIDQNPILGNRDGLLSIHEFQAGVNDLPKPGNPGSPTRLELGVRFHPDAPNALQGQGLIVDFIFYLAGVQEADLN